jgi:ricin-type beta-trefoil lectin protein
MLRRSFATGAALAVLVASFVSATATPAAAAEPVKARHFLTKETNRIQAGFRIWNLSNNFNRPDPGFHLCLVTQANTNGNPVFQWSGCGTSHFADQDWNFVYVGEGGPLGISQYQIVNANGGPNCLLTRNFGSAAFKAVQWDCAGYPDQFWYVEYDSSLDIYRFWNVNSFGDCLLVRASEVQASLTPCDNFLDQWWVLL